MKRTDFTNDSPGKLVNTPHGCCAFVPHPLPSIRTISPEIQHASERALLAIGELRAIVPSLPNPELLTQPFMRREAVLSSKIEGTRTEIEGLYLFESEQKAQPNSPSRDSDAREVHNYVVALEHGLNQIARMPICNRLLREMHKLLMEGVDDGRGTHKRPGEFRNVQAFIGGEDILAARYVAPPEDHVVNLMGKLEAYINDDSVHLPTLVKIALVHYQFEAIHPFSDGNGRLGRLLISLMLSATGILPEPLLYLSAFFQRHKDDYVRGMWEVSRAAQWEEWQLFFLRGVAEESADAVQRAKKLTGLREQYRAQLQTGNGPARIIGLVDQIFRWPIIVIPEAMKVLDMTYAGAQKNVDKLVELGILVPMAPGRIRNKLYYSKAILKILD